MLINLTPNALMPSIGKSLATKLFLKSALSVIFSPVSIVLMLLLTVGIFYILTLMVYSFTQHATHNKLKMSKDSFIKHSFKNNKSTLVIFLFAALCVNITMSLQKIIDNSTTAMLPYEKMCTIIPEKMLENNLSDDYISSAMDISGCNSQALPGIKYLWHMIPKKPEQRQHTHGQYNERERNEA